MDIIMQHQSEILAFLFALSELLALVPGIKSNSVFQLIFNGLKKVAGK
jgi:hypothetical protein